MSKVKPAVGQIWTNGNNEVTFGVCIDGLLGFRNPRFESQQRMPLDAFYKKHTFVPQNDLEWLAVNCDKWLSIFGQIFRTFIDEDSFGHCDDSVYLIVPRYTREQWQNMRYQLGLDDKPKEIKFTARCNRKKETKMQIDLTGAKVGDKFNCNHQFGGTVIMEIDYMSKDCKFVILKSDKSGTVIVNGDGTWHYGNDGSQCVVSKHDTRPWLKDLPDADLFCGSVWKLLYDAEMDKWCYSGGDVNEWTLITGMKMPHVEDGGAAITIPELRAWQLANKEQSE